MATPPRRGTRRVCTLRASNVSKVRYCRHIRSTIGVRNQLIAALSTSSAPSAHHTIPHYLLLSGFLRPSGCIIGAPGPHQAGEVEATLRSARVSGAAFFAHDAGAAARGPDRAA